MIRKYEEALLSEKQDGEAEWTICAIYSKGAYTVEKKKVMIICADLNIGGAQAVAARICKYAPEQYAFVYVLLTEEIGQYEEDILRKGGRIIHIPAPAQGRYAFISTVYKLMRQEAVDVVHCHNMFNCGIVMLAAKLAGVPCRVSHSHTIKEGCRMTPVRICYQWAMRMLIRMCGNVFLACGVKAGHVLYGKRWFDRKGIVIPNGIDPYAYAYSAENRQAIRKLYGLENQLVIGHVGHYVEVKNQAFLIDLMDVIRSRCPEAVLLLFGEGEDRNKLEERIREKNAEEYIRLMGNVRNIGQVLSAFDVFAFPSLFEGTPIALIEAQANGLPCIISDRIPTDACLTDDVHVVPLDDAAAWAEAVTKARRLDPESKADALMSGYEGVQASMRRIYAAYERHT